MQDSPIDTPLPPVLQRPNSSGLAIASMVFGVLSVTCVGLGTVIVGIRLSGSGAGWPVWLLAIIACLWFLGLLAGLPAIILGHTAYHRCRKAPEQYGRGGFATAGVVMGCMGILLTLLAIAVPNIIKARSPRSQLACVNNLKQIDGAKEQWALENHKRAGDPVVDDEVNVYLKNSARPICPQGGVYSYNAVGVNPTCSRGRDLGHTL